MGLWGAISTNLLNMVGVGPFITIPLALAAMGGPQAMLGWILGACLALCDGMVWAELGSLMPDSGGPYHYLLEAYGRNGMGRLFAFLFLWQALLIALICTHQGMRVEASAEKVGQATTRAVVLSIFAIIMADALFSLLFSWANI